MGVVYAGFIVVIGGFHPEGKGVAVAGAADLGVDSPVGQQVVLIVLFGPCGELHAVHAAGIGHGAGDGVAGGIHIRDLGVRNGGTGLIRSNSYLGGVLIRRVVKRFAVLVGILLVNGIERYSNFTGLIGQDVLIKAVIGAAVKGIIQPLIVILVGNDLMTLVVDIDVHCHLCTGVVRVKSPALYINVILPTLHHVHAQTGEVVAGDRTRKVDITEKSAVGFAFTGAVDVAKGNGCFTVAFGNSPVVFRNLNGTAIDLFYNSNVAGVIAVAVVPAGNSTYARFRTTLKPGGGAVVIPTTGVAADKLRLIT